MANFRNRLKEETKEQQLERLDSVFREVSDFLKGYDPDYHDSFQIAQALKLLKKLQDLGMDEDFEYFGANFEKTAVTSQTSTWRAWLEELLNDGAGIIDSFTDDLWSEIYNEYIDKGIYGMSFESFLSKVREDNAKAARIERDREYEKVAIKPTVTVIAATKTPPIITIEPQKEVPMSTPVKPKTLEIVKSAVVHGAKVAAADEAGNLVLSAVREMVTDSPMVAHLLETESGQQVTKLVAATAFIQAIESGMIPDESGNIRQGLSLVIEAAARDFIQPQLAKITPHLTKLASVAK